MEIIYESTQPAYVIIGVSILVCGFISVLTKKFLIPMVALSLMVFVFHSLTIRLSADKIEWYFGFGLWKYSESLQNVDQLKVVRTSWRHGFGIRTIDEVKLYNVSTGDALEFRLKSGRTFALESADPLQLKELVEKNLPYG